jgi:acylphosphatase
MSQTICRNLRISGRVQGVGYRWSLCAEAERLGLSGWVRNRRDGSVEALVSGPVEALDALLLWAQHGPSMAGSTAFSATRAMLPKSVRRTGSGRLPRAECFSADSATSASLSRRAGLPR